MSDLQLTDLTKLVMKELGAGYNKAAQAVDKAIEPVLADQKQRFVEIVEKEDTEEPLNHNAAIALEARAGLRHEILVQLNKEGW